MQPRSQSIPIPNSIIQALLRKRSSHGASSTLGSALERGPPYSVRLLLIMLPTSNPMSNLLAALPSLCHSTRRYLLVPEEKLLNHYLATL